MNGRHCVDSRWLHRFWACYQNDPAFRQEANRYYRIGGTRKAHTACEIVLPVSGADVAVDEVLVESIQVLNAQGFHTHGCCQGDAHQRTYVQADHLPPELIEVARTAGFWANDTEIRVVVPVSQPARSEAASRDFCRMLHDWARGELQSGGAYGHWRTGPQPVPLIRLPMRQPDTVQRDRDTERLSRQALKGKVGFQDIARLRSGRGGFSRMGVEEMLEKLELCEVPAALRTSCDVEIKKALR